MTFHRILLLSITVAVIIDQAHSDSSSASPTTDTSSYTSAVTQNSTYANTTPKDKEDDDLIPVIVGGVLALIVVATLIGYLIYRSRLPPQTLHMTNPNSHFEDVAFENKAGVLDDEINSDTNSYRNH